MPFLARKITCTTFIQSLWKIAFRHSASPNVVQKIAQFSKFAAGMMAARFLSIIAQIIMGRKFGPEIYGQFTIILLLASYFSMPMVNGWGLVFTKIVARTYQKAERLQALKSLLAIICCSSLFVTILLFLFKRQLAVWLDISDQMVRLIIAMSLCYGLWMLAKMVAQGYQNWYQYVLIENIWAVTILAGIILLSQSVHGGVVALCIVFFAGYLLAGFILAKQALQTITVRLSRLFFNDILLHGWFLLLNGLVGVATFSVDRILINRSLGPSDVGIYQAHFLATYGIISAFMTMMLTYIFPLFCKDEKKNIHRLLNKIVLLQYPVTTLFSLLIGGMVLWAYSYPVSCTLFITLCLFNSVQFHVQLKIWYIASMGSDESKITLIAQIIFLITNVVVLIVSIPKVGIASGGISLLTGASLSLLYIIRKEQSIFHERTV